MLTISGKLGRDLSIEQGRHARAAPGVAELPGGAPVEISVIVEV